VSCAHKPSTTLHDDADRQAASNGAEIKRGCGSRNKTVPRLGGGAQQQRSAYRLHAACFVFRRRLREGSKAARAAGNAGWRVRRA
jgi:hypothetical protein